MFLKPGLKPIELYDALSTYIRKVIKPMKNKLSSLVLFTSKINRQHIQIAFAALALVLFVLGAGAPDGGGGITPH